jgi:hypothetical protein
LIDVEAVASLQVIVQPSKINEVLIPFCALDTLQIDKYKKIAEQQAHFILAIDRLKMLV